MQSVVSVRATTFSHCILDQLTSDLDFRMYMNHTYHSSPGTESQGHRSGIRDMVSKDGNVVGPTSVLNLGQHFSKLVDISEAQ